MIKRVASMFLAIILTLGTLPITTYAVPIDPNADSSGSGSGSGGYNTDWDSTQSGYRFYLVEIVDAKANELGNVWGKPRVITNPVDILYRARPNGVNDVKIGDTKFDKPGTRKSGKTYQQSGIMAAMNITNPKKMLPEPILVTDVGSGWTFTANGNSTRNWLIGKGLVNTGSSSGGSSGGSTNPSKPSKPGTGGSVVNNKEAQINKIVNNASSDSVLKREYSKSYWNQITIGHANGIHNIKEDVLIRNATNHVKIEIANVIWRLSISDNSFIKENREEINRRISENYYQFERRASDGNIIPNSNTNTKSLAASKSAPNLTASFISFAKPETIPEQNGSGGMVEVNQSNLAKLLRCEVGGTRIFQYIKNFEPRVRDAEGDIVDEMVYNGYILCVEPIFWFSPHSAAKTSVGYQVYGTVANIAQWADVMRKLGNPVYVEVNDYMRDYNYMFNSVATKSLKLSKSFIGKSYVEETGEYIDAQVAYPAASEDGYKVGNDAVMNPTNGHGVQAYKIPGADPGKPREAINTGTHTWDEMNNMITEGSAPKVEPNDPKKVEESNKNKKPEDQIKPEELESVDIVKVYTEIQLGDDGEKATENHKGTFVRRDNPYIIDIENETGPQYNVKEWFVVNKDSGNPEVIKYKSTDAEAEYLDKPVWAGDIDTIPVPLKLKSGTGECQIDIKNVVPGKKKILYVHLVREIPPVITADLTESQISKVVSTNDKLMTMGTDGIIKTDVYKNWGSYSFGVKLDKLSQTSHGYDVHHTCNKSNCKECKNDRCHLDGYSTCNGISRINGDNKISYTFSIQNMKPAVSMARPGTQFDTILKSGTRAGIELKFDETVTDEAFERQFNEADTTSGGIAGYQTVWRGDKDKLTLAEYKKSSMTKSYDTLKTVDIASANSKIKNRDRHKNGTYSEQLEMLFGTESLVTKDSRVVGQCLGGGSHHGVVSVPQDATFTSSLIFEALVNIGVYAGTNRNPANATVKNQSPTSNRNSGSVSYANKQTGTIEFYPYIRMQYRVTADGYDDTHINDESSKIINRTAYMLGNIKSSIIPTNGVSIEWFNNTQSNNGYGLQLKSKQWSMHKKATEVTDKKNPWQGKDKVLPGGALYELSTTGTESVVTSKTYSTFIDPTSKAWINVVGNDNYTAEKIESSNNSYINGMKDTLENLRIKQWVTKDNSGKTPWETGKSKVSITGGNQETLQPGVKTSTDSKYLLTGGTTENGIMEADIDILKTNYKTVVYKCFTDTEGCVFIAKADSGPSTVPATAATINQTVAKIRNTCGTNRTGAIQIGKKGDSIDTIKAKLDTLGDIGDMNKKTGLVENTVNSIERNTGNDGKAMWVSDGHWYNEAFDGIYVVSQEITYTMGLGIPSKRIAILDPALCPKSTGKGDIFTSAYTSQFRLDSNSLKAPAGKNSGYIGTFENTDIEIPGIENMFISKPFSIPNATVQDLS